MTTQEFPPRDDAQRPATDDQGKQLAPETFARWVFPACWEDTAGNHHFDVHRLHRWLGWPLDEAGIKETVRILVPILESRMPSGGRMIVRP